MNHQSTVSATPADRNFLKRLLSLGWCRIEQICEEFGVTATAVRQRLSRLQASGLVDRRTVSSGRGRPHYEHRVTAAGRRVLGNSDLALAQLLWREITDLDDVGLRRRLLDRLQQSLVERYRPAGSAERVADRFVQLKPALELEGIAVELDYRESAETSLPILREHTCPYQNLASEDSSICELEEAVFAEVLGVPVTLTQCCRDGDPCCDFEPAETIT